MNRKISAKVFWNDGTVASARSNIFLDTLFSLDQVIPDSGTMKDGRPVKLINGNWVIQGELL